MLYAELFFKVLSIRAHPWYNNAIKRCKGAYV